MVVLRVIFVVWVLLVVVDMVLSVLEELVQVPAPLEVKHTINSKDSIFIMANIATEHVIVFNIIILLTCKVCGV